MAACRSDLFAAGPGTTCKTLLWQKISNKLVCPISRPCNNSIFLLGGLDLAGLESERVPEKWLLFRQEAADLWDALDKFESETDSKTGFDVQGSPGVGKSSGVWAWLCYQYSKRKIANPAAGGEAFAVWIHMRPELATRVVVLEKESIFWTDMTMDLAVSFLESFDARFLVLDGYRRDGVQHSKLREVAFMKKQTSVCQFLTVRSMAVKIYSTENKICGIGWYEVCPWSLEQYQKAASYPEFLTIVQSKLSASNGLSAGEVMMLIEKKYYYAGGNARWMFSMSQEELLAEIDVQFAGVSNVEDLLRGRVGVTSAVSSNHLLVRYKSGQRFTVFIISKFVASLLLSGSETAVYKIMYSMAMQQANPSFLGWVVEFDFISQLRQCAVEGKKFLFVNEQNSEARTEWSVSDVVDFDPDSEFRPSDIPVGTWLQPVKWDQEGYDLVSYFFKEEKHFLCFVQVTNAVEHVANLQHFQRLVVKASRILQVRLGVEIIVVSPAKKYVKIPTKIIIKNRESLNSFKIASTDAEWNGLNVDASIKYLYFERR